MWRVLLTIGCLAAVGCGGSKEFIDDPNWTKEPGAEGGNWRETESLFTPEESDPDRFDTELPGVRHDVSLGSASQPNVRCSCLDVGVGRPQEPKFKWAGELPLVGKENEVFAIRTQGANCPQGTSSVRRPSIRAVDKSGRDVVVVVEELPFGRPQALGAVIAKPKPGGSLYVRGRKRRLYKQDTGGAVPYGRGLDGSAMCKVYTRPSR
jgi:hypothetical protein